MRMESASSTHHGSLSSPSLSPSGCSSMVRRKMGLSGIEIHLDLHGHGAALRRGEGVDAVASVRMVGDDEHGGLPGGHLAVLIEVDPTRHAGHVEVRTSVLLAAAHGLDTSSL